MTTEQEFEFPPAPFKLVRAASSGSGFKSELFLDEKTAEELHCVLCYGTCKDIIQLSPCGHLFCNLCGAIIASSSANPTCPICRVPFKGIQDLQPSPVLSYRLSKMMCVCPYSSKMTKWATDCNWKGMLEEVDPHVLQECVYAYAVCQVCKTGMERRLLQSHGCTVDDTEMGVLEGGKEELALEELIKEIDGLEHKGTLIRETRRTADMEYEQIVWKSSKDIHEEQIELIVYAGANMAEKWRKDKSLPLVDVVQSFDIFTTHTKKSQGIAERASRHMIREVLGFQSEDEAIRHILEHGEIRKHKERYSNRQKELFSN